MATTVSISFDDSLLADIERQAQSDGLSRSELMRRAARLYIDRNKRWNQVFALGEAIARQQGLNKSDVGIEIHARRRVRRR